MGIIHGAYCLGCCWLLMLSGFALGRDEPGLDGGADGRAVRWSSWTPGGAWLGRLFGAGLVLWGSGLC